jgi:hypothetical protein
MLVERFTRVYATILEECVQKSQSISSIPVVHILEVRTVDELCGILSPDHVQGLRS